MQKLIVGKVPFWGPVHPQVGLLWSEKIKKWIPSVLISANPLETTETMVIIGKIDDGQKPEDIIDAFKTSPASIPYRDRM